MVAATMTVVVGLLTVVKELLDLKQPQRRCHLHRYAPRPQDYGLDSLGIIDNSSGIALADYDSIALKHHTVSSLPPSPTSTVSPPLASTVKLSPQSAPSLALSTSPPPPPPKPPSAPC
ncbi:hypothetical protein C8Q79DRAFT_1010865 [Trametes meyenii]|nr:hypothetical protein C8Q79DRAFT_1010865 [Trametes meyenii]